MMEIIGGGSIQTICFFLFLKNDERQQSCSFFDWRQHTAIQRFEACSIHSLSNSWPLNNISLHRANTLLLSSLYSNKNHYPFSSKKFLPTLSHHSADFFKKIPLKLETQFPKSHHIDSTRHTHSITYTLKFYRFINKCIFQSLRIKSLIRPKRVPSFLQKHFCPHYLITLTPWNTISKISSYR